MKIKLTSVYVDDQDKALRFYTEVLGFNKKTDFSQGTFRWLTVTSPDEPQGTELQLALNNNPAAKVYQQALFQQGQPAVMFFTDDIKDDYARIKARGAEFAMPPTEVTLDHRSAERHLWQPHPDHAACALVGCAARCPPTYNICKGDDEVMDE
jgi:predicted enzyme related to lactoylglutathione lyase